MIYDQLNRLTDDEFSRRRTGQLLQNVLSLSRNEVIAVTKTIQMGPNHAVIQDEHNAILSEARKSMQLLEISTSSEFDDAIRNYGFTEDYMKTVYEDGGLSIELSDFIDRSLAHESNLPL